MNLLSTLNRFLIIFEIFDTEKNYCLPNPCMNDGICNESPDGYVCTCGQGFQGKSCEGKLCKFMVADDDESKLNSFQRIFDFRVSLR